MIGVRYFRARQSHAFVTNNWHLYVFLLNRYPTKTDTGLTIKHRVGRRDGNVKALWRHSTLRLTHRRNRFPGYWLGRIQIEAVTHLSVEFNHSRVSRSKKFIRLVVAL